MKHCLTTKSIAAVCCAVLAAAISTNAGEIISQAVVTRPALRTSQALDSVDARISLQPRESIRIDVNLAVGDGTVRIEAPNGGLINSSRKAIELDAAKQGGHLGFDFSAGPNTGRYTVEITHGGITKTFQMWAGQEPPQGKPGPKLTFTGSR